MSAGRRLLRLGLLLVALALAAAAYVFQLLEHPRQPPAAAEVTVFFPYGTSTSEIFRQLAAEGVLRSAWFAEAYYRLARSATSLQAGEYGFARPTPLSQVIDRMNRGDVVKHTIVVPEGLTAEETFELFWSRGISRPEAFRNAFKNPQLIASIARDAPNLEGFLFPDTYAVTRSTSARRTLETMLVNFRKHFTPELRERARQTGLTLRETVTLASIVQLETALPREAPIIAGVYVNRLRRGMRLQADPTVAYALKGDGQWNGTLYRSDYGHESPFNTYLHEGLPPGPICNPGMAALKAAAVPAKTDFFYFVADRAGGHTFSRTFEEHRDAIAAIHRLREDASAPPPAPPSESAPHGNGPGP
ncbi:MAG: endolytic transglycosylase MltG [Acidobacteriota bacterium]